VPPRVDAVLRKIKYPLLVALLYFTFAEKELIFRMFDPFYALCSRHGEDITYLAYVTLGGIVVGSFLISMPFCRYLCPFAAVLNPFSRFGLLRITRDPANCLSCKMCDKVCEAGIPVSQVEQVTHARCTQCGECLSVCPKGEALYIGLPGQNPGADAAKASEQAAAQTAEGGK
jgi:polyferredoxin